MGWFTLEIYSYMKRGEGNSFSWGLLPMLMALSYPPSSMEAGLYKSQESQLQELTTSKKSISYSAPDRPLDCTNPFQRVSKKIPTTIRKQNPIEDSSRDFFSAWL